MNSVYHKLNSGRWAVFVYKDLTFLRYSSSLTKSSQFHSPDYKRESQVYLNPITFSYSTQPAKGALSVRHKEGINKFVKGLSKAERLELLDALSKTTTASQSSADSVQNAIPTLTSSQLSYGNFLTTSSTIT